MAGFARLLMHFLLAEAVAAVLALLIFQQLPHVLVVLACLAPWWAAGEWLSDRSRRQRLAAALRDVRGTKMFRRHTLALVIGVCGLGFILTTASALGPLTHSIYLTECCGESPDNRHACLYLQDGIIEFGVDYLPVEPPLFAVALFENEIDPQAFDKWFGDPGKPFRRRLEVGSHDTSTHRNKYQLQTSSHAITTTQSLYFHYTGDGGGIISLAYFGPVSEKTQDHRSLLIEECITP